MENKKNVYERRVNYYSGLSSKISKQMNLIANCRLFICFLSVISTIFLYKIKMNYIMWFAISLSIFLFIYLVFIYGKLDNMRKYVSILKEMNLSSVKRITGKWTDFSDKGDEFKDENHSYSYDLDIFGHGSLFQWINSAHTYHGRITLANILSNPSKNKDIINKRQEAVKELSSKRWWRNRIESEGMLIGENKNNEDLFNWSDNVNKIYLKFIVILTMRLLPIITIGTLALSHFTNIISSKIPFFLLLIQFFLTYMNITKKSEELNLVYKYRNNIRAYKKILKQFEEIKFKSDYLNELKAKLNDNNGFTATEQLNKLEKLADSISNRSNFMFLPINIIILWDYQCMIDLQRWKDESGTLVKIWIQVIGEIEALSSLANIGYDYPNWAIPTISEGSHYFKSESLGHPLISNNQVCNDIDIKKSAAILLITGSNMSGKSTFLRTMGINLVLAYSGAPVCADYMECSIMSIYTCMRTSDNLEKRISSFYGELLRIKTIIEAAKTDKQIFFLLDEIFKGTNSHDRHIGAKVLIRQLYNNGAVGLVSTHDLELGELENESHGSFKNYHFQEYYKDNNIYFDYKLRVGISTTRNALYLIKMIGIDLNEREW